MPEENIDLIEICYRKFNKEIDTAWEEIAKQYGFNTGEALRNWFKRYRKAKEVVENPIPEYDFEDAILESENKDSALLKIELATEELKKERMKVQTQNIDFNRRLREQSRADFLEERIEEAILKGRKELVIPNYRIEPEQNDSTMILSIADQHYGAEFEILDMFDNVMNKYSPEIFEARMWEVLNQTIIYAEKNGFEKVTILDLDDNIEGILHQSQLMSLRYGVVDSIIHFADFMESWLNELSHYLVADYCRVKGNHSDLRLLTGKKGDFPHENVSKLITKMLTTALRNNQNVSITGHNSIGCVYKNLSGFDVLATHGQSEKKNLELSVKDYMLAYNINVDYLYVGHLHSSSQKEIGINKEIIQTPSIMGANGFSQGLKIFSNAGAKITVLKRDYGRTHEKNIILK